MRPLGPHNLLSRITRHLQPMILERLTKHRAKIIPNRVVIECICEDLLRRAVVQALWRSCDFDGDAAGFGVFADGFEVYAAWGKLVR
jgi:hypothetical protein